jgi:hypothetical protein
MQCRDKYHNWLLAKPGNNDCNDDQVKFEDKFRAAYQPGYLGGHFRRSRCLFSSGKPVTEINIARRATNKVNSSTSVALQRIMKRR